MPTLVQLVHGYPPAELGGTELYTARVAAGLAARGWTVHVIAAHRAPGRTQGAVLEGPLPEAPGGRLLRVVNNLPWRPLGQAERDPLTEGVVQRALERLRPDRIHVQHLLFLSAHLALPAPAVATLHDAWGWCPRGGNLLRDGAAPCPGPDAAHCPRCYGAWARGSAAEHRLGQLAGRLTSLHPAITPELLHGAWRALPEALRALPRRGPAPTAAPSDLAARQEAVGAALRRCALRLAPSAWLAAQAEAQGLGPVTLLPHGVDPLPGGAHDGPLLFLGTLAPHKGADLVAQAWASRPGLPPLELRGPAVDAAYTAALPAALRRPALPPAEVPAALGRARALVLGSRWPENAPLTVLEARAAGCPVVAPRLGGLPELVEEGTDGLLYTPGDTEDLARALEAVCARPWPAVRPPPRFVDHLDRLEALYRGLSG